jgi:hypothetical protein
MLFALVAGMLRALQARAASGLPAPESARMAIPA